MPSSEQERLVAKFLENSFGASFLFEPSVYFKGNARREPADLAWYCRDTVVLMTMQRSTKSHDRQVGHNLKQLAGWLRMWVSGTVLEGRNSSRSFSVPISAIKKVVLLSVVDGPAVFAESHHSWLAAMDRRITKYAALAASLPQQALIALAERGGSVLDLIDILLTIRSEERQLSSQEAVALVVSRFQDAIDRAILRSNELNRAALSADETSSLMFSTRNEKDEILDDLVWFDMVAGVRKAESAGEVDAGSADDLALFNDLDWENSHLFAYRLADLVRMVRDVPVGGYGPRLALTILSLGPYTLVLGAADTNSMPDLVRRAEEHVQASDCSEPNGYVYIGIEGRPEVRFIWPMLAMIPVGEQSATTQSLIALAGSPDTCS